MNKNSEGARDRLVLHFPGFEPAPAKFHYIRFKRECRKFRKLWDVQQEFGRFSEADGASHWQTKTVGSNWAISTRMVVLEWCSFLDYPEKSTFWQRIFYSSPLYFAHFTTLAPWRFFKANWRYGLTFIYPILTLLLVAALSGATIWGTAQLVSELPLILSISIGIAVFLVVLNVLGQRWALPMAFEFSHHAYSISLPDNKSFQSRVADFSSIITKEIAASTAEEINITTHSIGSVYGVAALANALRQNPDLLAGKTLYFTAIASSVLHNALMTRCQWLRDDLKLVLEHPGIQWTEIYATNDPLCFNKCSPEIAINGKSANRLISRRVRFSRMVDKKRYRFMRFNFFQLHRQMIMTNDHRYFYDFYLILFGPRNVVDLLQRKPFTEI